MSRLTKTDHNGPKNGGGYWGKRAEAKQRSKKVRREQSKRLTEQESATRDGAATMSNHINHRLTASGNRNHLAL